MIDFDRNGATPATWVQSIKPPPEIYVPLEIASGRCFLLRMWLCNYLKNYDVLRARMLRKSYQHPGLQEV